MNIKGKKKTNLLRLLFNFLEILLQEPYLIYLTLRKLRILVLQYIYI
jgi:hypothetical protein